MINQAQYLNKLINWKDKPIIKVITGVGRCGKSSFIYFICNKSLPNTKI